MDGVAHRHHIAERDVNQVLVLVQKKSNNLVLPLPVPMSRTGRCGNSFGGQSCQGSSYGNCCSQYDWCGKTDGHCKTRCQPGFGTCFPSGSSSSIPQ
ncbi:hypothetical protein GQ44DRAFT_661123, partial [Phaeosphaeriaceae sp. PMI808]